MQAHRQIAIFVATLFSAYSLDSSAQMKIMSYDTPSYIELQSSEFLVYENETNALVTVVRTGDFRRSASVDYQVTESSATSGVDFKPKGGTLVFAAGESFKIISIPVIHDEEAEENETIQVLLQNAGSNVMITRAEATLIIRDVPPLPRLQIAVVGQKLRLSWSATAGNCVLERSHPATNQWETVMAAPVEEEGLFFVEEPMNEEMFLYRLRS
ncbi:MAG: Calx-beta domain-containing protein [Verrucomicrobiota bacterium]|nr:Calx-beta domain-containing protein [Verrucomicrobiota bacterium]